MGSTLGRGETAEVEADVVIEEGGSEDVSEKAEGAEGAEGGEDCAAESAASCGAVMYNEGVLSWFVCPAGR